MIESGKTRPVRQPPESQPYSTWWLLAKDGNPLTEVLTVRIDGGRILPAFSGEDEAQMFLWLGGTFEGGWHIRETSAGELVSLLSGPCAGVRSVALDPSPGMAEAGTIDLVSVDRKRFVGWVIAFGKEAPAPSRGRLAVPRRSGYREVVTRAAGFRSDSSSGFTIGGRGGASAGAGNERLAARRYRICDG